MNQEMFSFQNFQWRNSPLAFFLKPFVVKRKTVPQEIRDIVEDLVVDNNFDFETSTDSQRKLLLKDKPVVALGAGATAILGASSFSKVFPASSVMKIVTLNTPTSLKLFLTHTHKAAIAISKILGSSKVVAPGLASSGAKTSTALKAAVSAEKISAVTHSVIASAQKTSLSAMRTAFYEIMRKRRAQRVGYLPWATFACSIATCAGLVTHGDGIECAVASLPAAPAIASLGRGIQNLQEASNAVSETSRTKIQKAMESLMYRIGVCVYFDICGDVLIYQLGADICKQQISFFGPGRSDSNSRRSVSRECEFLVALVVPVQEI